MSPKYTRVNQNSHNHTMDGATIPTTYSSQHLINSLNEENASVPQSDNVDRSSINRRNTSFWAFDVPRDQLFTVAVLCFINLINYMDRFTIAGVLTELQADFSIEDSKAGLLQTAFILSYMIFAPIFGYLGDRYPRKLIMGFGVALWCATTFIGSFMPTYEWFMLFRALVGIGEASYSTIAPTIISDLFVKDLRSKCLTLFYFAIPVGSGLGYMVGSETANLFQNWRWALRVTPFLGIAAVILLIFCTEPERGHSEGTHDMQATSYSEDLRALVKNPSFMLSTAGFTCVAFVAGALAWWGPTYIFLGMKSSNIDVNLNSVSLNFGIVNIVCGVIGVPMGTYLSHRFIKKYPRCDPLICAFGLLLSAPLMCAAILTVSESAAVTFVLIFFAVLSLNLNWAIVADILLYVVVPTRRSTAEAFQILISHALGDAGSPYLIGVISDRIKGVLRTSHVAITDSILMLPLTTEKFLVLDPFQNSTSFTHNAVHLEPETDETKFKALQYALFTTSFVEILGAIFFLITAAYILKDKSRAEQAIQDSNTPRMST